jgi:ATP-dependent helicase Lhr and Lhr-like helicase
MESVFHLLDQRIRDLLSTNNIERPTEPQCKAIPAILGGDHVLLIAPTGLGKTESALLPLFHELLHLKDSPADGVQKKGISILYITPLRALNRDMLHRTFDWGKHLGISVAVRHGDTSQSERAKQARNPPDMLITTPETLQILFTGRRIRSYLSTVRWVVIDEVHELAGDERGAQLAVGLERLLQCTRHAGHEFQRIGLSATVGLPMEVARYLGGREQGRFRPVSVLEIDVTKHIDIQVEMPVINNDDYTSANKLSMEPISFALLRRCKELIDIHTSTLLFINTRDGAEILASRFHLWHEDLNIGVHHGSLSKHARIEAENEFKAGTLKSLVCTSSLELGIDVGDTDFVIQYNSPREVTRVVQRVGRSGHRVGRTSKGMILATNPEDLSESLVIARRALAGSLEQFYIRQNPLSVLSNQIISVALEYGRIKAKTAHEIISRAYPFHQLSWSVFESVVHQLKDQRSIWLEEEQNEIVLVKRTNSRHYFLDNISMIPDEKTFPVIDISTRRSIGTLDESFVLSSGFEGEKFILRGRPWMIVKREDTEILVTPIKEIGTVPSWIGEDIPVPFEVAQEVGKLRTLASEHKDLSNYPCSNATLKQFNDYIGNQKQHGFVVPDDTHITFDVEEKTMVINACFGTKVNETIGRLIAAVLAQSIGESIGINSDAYRISLELPGRIPPERVKEVLLTTQPEMLEYLMKTILRNSTYLRWQLVHVARKFGALRKDFDYKAVGIKRLFGLFEQSLIFEEALDKLMWERMDIQHTVQVLQKIQNGDITIHIQGLSPISLSGFETIRGLMVPQRADRTILMALKKRLEDADVIMVCTNCHRSWNTYAGRATLQPKCSNCGAIKIGVIRRYNKKYLPLLSKKHRTTEENKEVKRLHKNASLVLSYGKFAVLALVGRGIGPDTAARILGRYNKLELGKSEELEIKFLRDILQAELQYAKTRGFWDA